MDEIKIIPKVAEGKKPDKFVSKKNNPSNPVRNDFNNILEGKIKKPLDTGEKNLEKNKKPSEVRKDLVNKYRLGLEKGTYNIKAFEIAEKIVQVIRDDKSKT